MLSETWLHPDVDSCELFPSSYTVFRADRKYSTIGLSRGGGVLLAVKETLPSNKMNTDTIEAAFPSIDIVGCKMVSCMSRLLIYVLYIPPSTSSDVYESFLEAFEVYNSAYPEWSVVIVGDFNVPLYYTEANNNHKAELIANFSKFLNINQVNEVVNNHGRLLDLVFVNFDCTVSRSECSLVSEDVYHPALAVTFNIATNRSDNFDYSNSCVKYNFKRANFPLMYDMILSHDWNYLNIGDIDKACGLFYKDINHIISLCTPTYKNFKRHYPPWFTAHIISLIRHKSHLHHKFKKHNTESHRQEYRQLRTTIKHEIKLSYSNYIQNIEYDIKTEPTKFWSFIQSKKNKPRIPGAMFCEEQCYTDSQSIVNSFANFFSSVYHESSELSSQSDILSLSGLHIKIKSITEDDIIKASKKLKNKMTSGIDNIPSFLVKDCIHVLAQPLSQLFNTILATNTYPDIWKTSKICPIFKSGDPKLITNYRPIAILCNFSKLLEIIIYDNVYSNVKNSISQYQFGFMERRSTVSNLLCMTQYISEFLDDHGQVDVIYTDLQKAFDRIDHYILLKKLKMIGFSVDLLLLMKSYLIDRRQYVEFGGYKSVCYKSTSGVPQGSNLGPLLFLIFMNDFSLYTKSCHLLFADDLKIFLKIDSVRDCILLQGHIDEFTRWCTDNCLQLNVNKCKVVSYHRKLDPVLFNYSINGFQLEKCSLIKDLGIIFDYKLSFNSHINQIVSAAVKMLGYCVRNWKEFSDNNTLRLLYITFIRCKLEYASVVWSPFYRNSIQNIESVQRKCIKYMLFKSSGVYPERGTDHSVLLSAFDLQLLSERRKCTAVSVLYGVLRGTIDCPFLLDKITFLVPRHGNRHHNLFYNSVPNTNLLIKSPVYNMLNTFNSISHLCDINHDSLSKIINVVRNNEIAN